MITPEYRFINKKQDKFDKQVMYPNIDIKYYHWTKNSNEKHNKSIDCNALAIRNYNDFVVVFNGFE